METEKLLLAFGLTAIAGLATVIGALLTTSVKNRTAGFLSLSLGFSAGVMVYVSFFELIRESQIALAKTISDPNVLVIAFFLVGLGIAAVIDFFTHRIVHEEPRVGNNSPLLRAGIFTAVAIAVHNFPEGIATFMTASDNISLGIPLAAAIAIHNIPEGMCVSLPICYATGSRLEGIKYALVAGLAEPLGAILALLILYPFWNSYMMGVMLAAVAGIMVYVALDELLPNAKREGGWQKGLSGFVLGMIFMFLMTPLVR